MQKHFFYYCLVTTSLCALQTAFAAQLEPPTLYPQVNVRDLHQNWLTYPANQWSYQHVSELAKTAIISTKNNPEATLPQKKISLPLRSISFENFKGKKNDIDQWLKNSNTDGFIVLQNGSVLYEFYGNGSTPDTLHQMFSVTKSFVGTLASALCTERRLDANKKVTDYVPELRETAYREVTVQELMDMRVSFNNFSEHYDDRYSHFYKYVASVLSDAQTNTEFPSLRSYLVNLKRDKKDNSRFNYATVNTDVLAWVLEKVTKKKIQDLISERIWSKIGASSNAYMIVDRNGVGWAGAGLNATLRDIAKFGQMMLQNGSFHNQQIIPKDAVKEIEMGGDKQAFEKDDDSKVFKGFSYKNQWWITHDEHGAYMAIGIYGQWIYIDPKAQMVMVKQSALKEADTDENAHNAYEAMSAIAHYLVR